MDKIDLNYLALKISSLAGNQMDGDFILTLESHLPASLNRVQKWIADNKPKGHEKLLEEEIFSSFFDYKNTYKCIPLAYSSFITSSDGFLYLVELSIEETGDYARVEQCNSFVGLDLAERHGVPYYMIKEDFLYFVIPTNYAEQNIRVTHYKYKSLVDFPDELEEFLINDLIRILIGTKDEK